MSNTCYVWQSLIALYKKAKNLLVINIGDMRKYLRENLGIDGQGSTLQYIKKTLEGLVASGHMIFENYRYSLTPLGVSAMEQEAISA